MIPWRPVLVFAGVSVGTTTAIAILCAVMGWTIHSPAWALLAPIAMWAPAAGRFVTRSTVDRSFTATLPVRRWGATGARVIVWPVAVPLAIYGAAYGVAWSAGLASWNPGGGKWTSGQQVAANLLANLSILSVVGTFTALGEELGWRGYLQPRLDAAGVRWSVAVVCLCQFAYHAPLIVGAGYADAGGVLWSLTLFAAAGLPVAFLFARESYLARSVWPAVFFHSFHNTISQWLFPKLFAGGDNELWLGEGGLLPAAGYIIFGAAVFVLMKWRGPSWQALVRAAVRA